MILNYGNKFLNNEVESFATFNLIKSDKLNIYTIYQTKVALSNFDDKRHILNDGYSTLAYGHYKINALIPVESLRSQHGINLNTFGNESVNS